ncbi:Holliday junction ATP-dependent DNA helicase RuvA [Candidatus Clavichlamydia salmonicola]|uniref:Holliday junction branch migration protein RuvA n=1 Tax=Candidatus Clavichlamydia salmonicola TaxID=469812 RepID=UPI001891A31D|nr:Holliday junction branch migration protein RuvA [Candidatus Clavichlamydia salmonicola]MBF5050977.1 Holliday junction ATP-dependent DNA helicase RuvA [Candidatus Clavichlamydia salmonicola]
MYDFIIGKICAIEKGMVVIENNGIGYRVAVTERTALSLHGIVEKKSLFIAVSVKENGWFLYGFPHREERDYFESLITVSGVGPKIGLAILNTFSVRDLDSILAGKNVSALSSVPGIGKKTAERLLLDLKGKTRPVVYASNTNADNVSDAVQALVKLGYSRLESEKMMRQTLEVVSSTSDVSELIGAALRHKS